MALDGSIRLDTGIREGDHIVTHYPSKMVSKLIVHANYRQAAMEKLKLSLEKFQVIGMPTNIKFLGRILAHQDI